MSINNTILTKKNIKESEKGGNEGAQEWKYVILFSTENEKHE